MKQKHRSREFWKEAVARAEASPLTRRKIAAELGVGYPALTYWITKLRAEDQQGSSRSLVPIGHGSTIRSSARKSLARMLSLPPKVSVYLWVERVDMRKGFDGLGNLERERHDIFEGDLFVFVGRRKDRCKILFWERGGFLLFYKRLERGRFKLPEVGNKEVIMTGAELAMLLDGIDFSHFLFVGTETAGKNIAGIYSLITTCDACGVNPLEYLADVMRRVSSHPASQIDELLPERWKAAT